MSSFSIEGLAQVQKHFCDSNSMGEEDEDTGHMFPHVKEGRHSGHSSLLSPISEI